MIVDNTQIIICNGGWK